MRTLLLGFAAAGLLSISCKKDERPTYIKDENGSQPVSTVDNTPKASLMAQSGIQTAQPTQMATAPGMNPPHGQPGHRCDIPVGQPLNSAPTQAPQQSAQNITVNANQGQTIQIDPNSLKQVNNNKSVKTAPGMNPPHGEPGHRCDIPVGQPLNSKPASTSQPTQTIAQNTPIPAPAPAPTGPKPELNPAHGEPWHDCAKKVGDPL